MGTQRQIDRAYKDGWLFKCNVIQDKMSRLIRFVFGIFFGKMNDRKAMGAEAAICLFDRAIAANYMAAGRKKQQFAFFTWQLLQIRRISEEKSSNSIAKMLNCCFLIDLHLRGYWQRPLMKIVLQQN